MEITLQRAALKTKDAKSSSCTKTVTVSFSAAEFIELTKKAKSANLTLQQLLKRLALESIKKQKQNNDFY